MARHNIWRRILRIFLVFCTIVTALGTAAGAYGGDLPPTQYRYFCLMVMTFPMWLGALILFTLLDIFFCHKALFISIVTFVACGSAIWEYSPLNIFPPSASRYENCPKFTLLSFNALNFVPIDSVYPDGMNPIISYILSTDADVVCLQEAALLSASTEVSPEIPAVQIDSIFNRYPYVLSNGHTQLLLSKYPAKALPTGHRRPTDNEIVVYRLTIDGTNITLMNVHLEPYHLRKEDKQLYRNITNMKNIRGDIKDNFQDIRFQLLHKIQASAEAREYDAERLGSYITRLGGPNIIITGDFNDVPGCYTLRRLADFRMKQVYPEVGFGPMITYYANRFYFRIDHTLYRGDLQPLRMWRGKTRLSDHYPLMTTFAITGHEAPGQQSETK